MTRQLNTPKSLHNELSELIFSLAERGFTVALEVRNYTAYGEIYSFVSGSGIKIEPRSSELFVLGDETDYRPSLKDLEDYRDELATLLERLNKEAA